MAKHVNRMGQASKGTATKIGGAETVDAIGRRVVTFARQLEQFARTLQAKAGGGMNRDRLHREIASVRDRAAGMLERLSADGVMKAAPKASKRGPAAVAIGRDTGRSGGAVDAPGKRHRTPMPTDPGASVVGSQAAKMRTIRTMAKTNRHRGRG